MLCVATRRGVRCLWTVSYPNASCMCTNCSDPRAIKSHHPSGGCEVKNVRDWIIRAPIAYAAARFQNNGASALNIENMISC